MTTTMTERDKKLLLFMACVLLLVGFGLGIIKPLLEASQNMNAEILEAQEQKLLIENRVMTHGQMKTVAEESASMAEEGANRFYPMMRSQDIDREITSVILSQGLKVEQLTIKMPEDFYTVVPYPLSEMASSLMAPEEASMEEAPAEGEEAPEAIVEDDGMGLVTTTISTAEVQVVVSGSMDAFWNLLDTFESHKEEIRVVRMAFGSAGTDSQAMDTMTVELEVFMCDKDWIAEE